MSDNQKRGACSHIMAAADPHTRCTRCRTCDIIDKPCSVCCELTTEQRNAAVKARASRLRWLALRKERAASADSSSSRHSSVGSDSRPIQAPSVSGQEGREGAGVPLEVVVNVTTGPRDGTAVTQTEPRTDSVADKCPLDPSRKRASEQEGPDPSRKRVCERAVDRTARKRSKGNTATLDPSQRLEREQAALDPPLRRVCEQAVLDPPCHSERVNRSMSWTPRHGGRENRTASWTTRASGKLFTTKAREGRRHCPTGTEPPLHHRGRSRSLGALRAGGRVGLLGVRSVGGRLRAGNGQLAISRPERTG